ncbi:DNA topoisomerase 2-associated protein pat1 [Elasticomyces elasticus]|nr:DNA topoisomerase 2-associated protein pat1 [Elasticomyces elasticus]KAK3656092.1 DNA topoisomerase 2-associated protein pat1 [Elasticomyces elasticus]KAK4922353.1 DNA topoisomerase 2-associated protein pat1 [Elasticomyces elasticus]KAK5763807.1 DNA topoisomerase 2-associated protein pat1 [Elasticomyces elasticus]
MSFFGFDTSLPRDRPPQQQQQQQQNQRGIFDQHDPFAARNDDNEDEVLNFEETYDGLGQQLNESLDTFNEDTFGGDSDIPATRASVGRDFDFAGQTAAVRNSLLEEQQGGRQQGFVGAGRAAAAPARTGYEAYKMPGGMQKLEADASIWGPRKAATAVGLEGRQESGGAAASARKMMSLEEVEAMMRGQGQNQAQPQPQANVQDQAQGLRDMLGLGGGMPQQQQQQQMGMQDLQQQQRGPVQILQRPQHPSQQNSPALQHAGPVVPQHLQQQQPPRPMSRDMGPPQHPQHQHQHPMQQQQQFQQQPPGQFNRPLQGVAPAVQPPHIRAQQQQQGQHPQQHPQHQRGPSYNGPPITQAQQLQQLSPEDRAAFLEEEAKRAKRNHKIFLLSKNNGLMTPQDKNFITRIQLQQLLTATGGIDNEMGSDQQMAEDFYYQVYAQIRGAGGAVGGEMRNTQFAQTYLLQTGGSGRYGYGRGRNQRNGGGGTDNHVQRMEQQVARAVEAAKARPKNKSLVVEGSLGKIAFSNSKTPRPLLNIKRVDSEARVRQAAKVGPGVKFDRKQALRDIETMYSALMKLEDHERKLPPPPNEESSPEVIEGHMRWRSEMQGLNEKLWSSLKVMAPIEQSPTAPHPFIQILSHGKGKKAIPRVFRHLDDQQRLTMLTLIVIHLDILDVIRDAYPPADNTPIPARVKEEVELFGLAVMPPLFSYVNEAPLGIIVGLLGLVLDRVHLQGIVRTKVGVGVLTMLISRAELVKQQPPPSSSQQQQSDEDRQQYSVLYNRLFDTLEPVLPYLFPTDTNISASDDVHVWQFLAAMGVGASPEDQQQRLVVGVKERVMETVAVSQGLPEGMRERRLGEVNLFMRAIGLDVELLG